MKKQEKSGRNQNLYRKSGAREILRLYFENVVDTKTLAQKSKSAESYYSACRGYGAVSSVEELCLLKL